MTSNKPVINCCIQLVLINLNEKIYILLIKKLVHFKQSLNKYIHRSPENFSWNPRSTLWVPLIQNSTFVTSTGTNMAPFRSSAVLSHTPYGITTYNNTQCTQSCVSKLCNRLKAQTATSAHVWLGFNPQATNVIYIYIYIYMEHPFLMFLDHTQRRSTVGRTSLDE